MSNKKQIVIIGGSGFIGTALIKKLKDKECNNIIAINAHRPCEDEQVKTVIDDMTDKSILSNVIKSGSVVVHLAWSSNPSKAEGDRIEDINKNLAASLNLLDTCVDNKIDKIIFLSSGGTVYGNLDRTASKETDNTNPKNSYGVLKLTVEKYMGVYTHLYGLKSIIIRLANAYGRKK